MIAITNLAKRRIDKGYTVRKLSRLSGIPERTLHAYENRQRSLDNACLSTIVTICEVLEVPIQYITESDMTARVRKIEDYRRTI